MTFFYSDTHTQKKLIYSPRLALGLDDMDSRKRLSLWHMRNGTNNAFPAAHVKYRFPLKVPSDKPSSASSYIKKETNALYPVNPYSNFDHFSNSCVYSYTKINPYVYI